MYRFFILVLLVLLYSCTPDTDTPQQIYVGPIPEEVEVTMQHIPILSDSLLYASRIAYHQGKLVLTSRKGPRRGYTHIDYFDLEKSKILNSFNDSEGPESLGDLEFYHQTIVEGDSTKIIFYSRKKGFFKLPVAYKDSAETKLEYIKQGPLDYPVNSAFLSPNQQFVFGFYMDEAAYYNYSLQDKKYQIRRLETIPASFNLTGIAASNALAHHSAYHPASQTLSAAYTFFNRIDLFDIQGNLKKSIKLGDDANPVNIPMEDDGQQVSFESTMYSVDLELNEDLLAVSYFGKPKRMASSANAINILLISRSENKVLFNLKILGGVYDFTFDDTGKTLYLLSGNEAKNGNLFKIDLQDIMQ